jgi:hypothetical protein
MEKKTNCLPKVVMRVLTCIGFVSLASHSAIGIVKTICSSTQGFMARVCELHACREFISARCYSLITTRPSFPGPYSAKQDHSGGSFGTEYTGSNHILLRMGGNV